MHAPCGGSVVVDAGVYVENIVVSRNLSIYRCKLTSPITGFHCVAVMIMKPLSHEPKSSNCNQT
jgi:hypothetical protein